MERRAERMKWLFARLTKMTLSVLIQGSREQGRRRANVPSDCFSGPKCLPGTETNSTLRVERMIKLVLGK